MATKKPAEFNFETTLQELNQLVEKLERGGLPLEESLKSFERGIALTRECQKALQTAEQKVQILLAKNGETTLAPYAKKSDDDA